MHVHKRHMSSDMNGDITPEEKHKQDHDTPTYLRTYVPITHEDLFVRSYGPNPYPLL